MENNIIKEKNNSIVYDLAGVGSSFLCFLHCNISVVFYAVRLSPDFVAACQWEFIDYIFLFVSFVAVYNSAKNTSNAWIATAFWLAYAIMFLSTVLPHNPVYMEYSALIGAFGLMIAHIWNMIYCQICNSKKC